MAGLTSILSHSPSIVTRKTGNEYVLVPITNNIADMNSVYALNDTGAFIWEHINGKRSVEKIIDAVTTEYDINKTIFPLSPTEKKAIWHNQFYRQGR
ncbi:MAG: PqqD family protein [Bacteroidales bacterium]|nr:PqqD family protein [Bacteroidales bacterium]